jgi:competence protein ComEC
VVFSGSNMAIVSENIFRLFRAARLPRRGVYALGAVGIVLFAILAGGGAATVRAVVMGLIAIVARVLRRPAAALRVLVIAGALMVLWNPLVLLYDRGFMLSMLATFGLITLAPRVEKYLTRIPAWPRYNLRSIVATTLAVEIFILPALLYYSGVLSFVSLPLNALVLPIVPWIMLGGFITGVAGMLHPALALIPGLATDLLLRLVVWLTETSAHLPFASMLMTPFPAWVVLAAYIPLTWGAIVTMRRSEPRPPTN